MKIGTILIRSIIGAAIGVCCYFSAMHIEKEVPKNRDIEPRPTQHGWIYLAADIALMIFAVIVNPIVWNVIYVALSLVALTVVAIADIKYRLIPITMDFALFILKLLHMFSPFLYGVQPAVGYNFKLSFLGMAICLFIFAVPAKLIGKRIGTGDVILAGVMGFCLTLRSSLTAIVFMGLFTILLIIAQRRMALTDYLQQLIPMGAVIAPAFMLVMIMKLAPYTVLQAFV